MNGFLNKLCLLCLVGLLGLIILLGLFLRTKNYSEGSVEILNKSGEEINELEIYVCNNRFHFWNLPVGSTVGFSYKVDGESGYAITLRFSSGNTIETKVGYVTQGFDYSDRLIVLIDRIEFERWKVTDPRK